MQDRASTRSARVDIVINNAGILRDKSFHNMTPDLLDPVLDVHLRGRVLRDPAGLRRTCASRATAASSTPSSGAGIFGNFGQANYGAAKMGLVGFTRVLAVEGAKNNIKANAIAPVAKTRMTEDLLGRAGRQARPRVRHRRSSPAWPTRTCPVTGEIYSVGGGRIARVFIGVTAGLHQHRRPDRRGRPRPLRQDPRRGRLLRPRQPQRGAHGHPQGAELTLDVHASTS